ncbi:LysR family transcriptional regulator [Alphaproteobacteria bacterium KMM 3653]|uniref:LysR family transcriptional regulator n=1 Tax=Harenicola maris TaxID=2841044 RepID=A0AAP2CKE7_9RHOB|nr:LysR family transcriptional regulator [Harenicola maris]
MLNATWLETFTVLCEQGHFTRTAERLNMTQPGVSQHLRKLEGQLGQSLIAREGKGFTLTQAGEAVFAMGLARRAEERALREAVSADDPARGEVSLACSGSFATWIYPHLLSHMREAPELVLRVTAAPQGSIVAGVLEGLFDLGVTAERPRHPRLEAVRLAREELCLVLPAAYAGRRVDLEVLEDLGFVAHPDGYAYADELLGLNFPESYAGADHLRVRTEVNQIGQIPIPVAQGLGYTILPKSGVDAFAGRGDLAVISLPKRRYHALWLIARRGRFDFARIAAVRGAMEGVIRRLGE